MFSERILGEGCWTYVYFGIESTTNEARYKEIFFTKDHFHSFTDCQLLNINMLENTGKLQDKDLNEDFKNCCLQACSITDGDQEIYLKTQVKTIDMNGEKVEKTSTKASKC